MGEKILLETPTVMESMELFPSQEETKNSAVSDILQNKNTFFSIEGGYGSGKSVIATAIGNELTKFKCVHFNVWSTDESAIRRQFLFSLLETNRHIKKDLSTANSKDNNNSFSASLGKIKITLDFISNNGNKKEVLNKNKSVKNNLKKKSIDYIRDELSIKLGELLPKKNICPFIIIIFPLIFMTIFSMFIPIINMFRNTSEALVFFGKPIASLNIVAVSGIVLSIIPSTLITCFLYRNTGGTIFAANISLFGLSMKKEAKDIDEHNFKEIFQSIAKENTYIILDDIDRVEKKNIGKVLAFLELLKESAEAVRYESMKNSEKIIISVCVPVCKEQLYFLLPDIIIGKNFKINDSSHVLVEKIDETNKHVDDFMHKIFIKKYETKVSDMDINIILKNKGLNEDTAKEINKNIINTCFPLIKNNNLRQTSRNIEEYFELLEFYYEEYKKYENKNECKLFIITKDLISSCGNIQNTSNYLIESIAIKIKLYYFGKEKIYLTDIENYIDEKISIYKKNDMHNSNRAIIENLSSIKNNISKNMQDIKTEIDRIKNIENKTS